MKKLMTFAFLMFFIYACTDSVKKENPQDNDKPKEVTQLKITDKEEKKSLDSLSKKEEVILITEKKQEQISGKKPTQKKVKQQEIVEKKDKIEDKIKPDTEKPIDNIKEIEVKDSQDKEKVEPVKPVEEPVEIIKKVDERQHLFVKKKNKIAGKWSLKQEGNKIYIVFHSNFKTKKGPDLKVFLTNQTLDKVTAKTALKGSVLISKLKSNSGEQRYLIPSNIDISQYKTILIHCEKYTILWGGGTL